MAASSSAKAPEPTPKSSNAHAARPFTAKQSPLARIGGGWAVLAWTLAALAAFPLISVFGIALSPSGDVWAHLADTVLIRYLTTTLLLGSGVGLLVAAIGVGAGWLVAMHNFPGRRMFEWALLLPLAIPAYITGYVYSEMMEYSGIVQSSLRAVFGWANPREYWFPEIRSLEGAVVLFGLALYPYVYVLARAAFLAQGAGPLEAARSLGAGPARAFFRVSLPLARPAIVVGAALAMMETLNDIAIPLHFGLQTFSTGIFDAWLHMGSAAAAAQLALAMLALVAGLMVLERWGRRGRGVAEIGRAGRKPQRRQLRGWQACLASLLCLAPVAAGFIAPAAHLVDSAISAGAGEGAFLELAANSIVMSALAAFAALAVALGLAYGYRLRPKRALKLASRFANLGYAVPGAVLGLGVLLPLAAFDNWLDGWMQNAFGFGYGLLLTGSIAALVFACTVRFLPLAYGSVEAGLERVTPSMDGAARTLGCGPLGALARVHAPLLRSSIVAALILVFVDCMKELPMTLLLRPFGFETLATHVYQYASDEQLEASALAALAIVAAGLAPLIILSRVMDPTRKQ